MSKPVEIVNVIHTSSDATYLSQHIALRSGLPIETPAVTLNRLCGSGFEAIATVERELGLKRDLTNCEGIAIAIGHSLAASGAKIATNLLYSLREDNGGLGAACIGGGQEIALLLKV